MPLYEYKCEKCGEQFDIRQCYGQDGSKLKCPKCGEANPRKLISGFSTSASSAPADSGRSCYIPRAGG
ncbi:MAG: zinc ribbon domain-containing protein [Chloroflexota bacterium]|nr:zinc ribbon domain-containing protein [Chloroflexota bacterium]